MSREITVFTDFISARVGVLSEAVSILSLIDIIVGPGGVSHQTKIKLIALNNCLAVRSHVLLGFEPLFPDAPPELLVGVKGLKSGNVLAFIKLKK